MPINFEVGLIYLLGGCYDKTCTKFSFLTLEDAVLVMFFIMPTFLTCTLLANVFNARVPLNGNTRICLA